MSDFTDNYTYSIETDFKSNRTFTTLEWRTEPPTEPGWYWAASKHGGDPQCVCVVLAPEAGLEIYSHEYNYDLDNFYHWLGPLPVPEMPR